MTCYPMLRLEADGLDPLPLDESAGVFVSRVDLGDAVTRVVSDDAPSADGTFDDTEFIGARAVTLRLTLFPDAGSPFALRQRLRAFTHPRRRPHLFVQQDADAPEQRITLRRGPYDDVFAAGQGDSAAIVAQWVAPLGIVESAQEHVVDVFAAGGATAGRTYSLTFSRVYPASAPLGVGTVTNAGNADAYPVVRLFGPCTEPVLTSDTQDRSLTFVGLTLTAGEYLEIDTRAKTILLTGDPTASRYSKLDFPGSTWFTLAPGDNDFRFHPATFTEAVTVAQFLFRDAWL